MTSTDPKICAQHVDMMRKRVTKQSSCCWLPTKGSQGGSCVGSQHAVDQAAQVVRVHVTPQPPLKVGRPPEVDCDGDALALHLMPPPLWNEQGITCLHTQTSCQQGLACAGMCLSNSDCYFPAGSHVGCLQARLPSQSVEQD